jgi:hypothetical protein
MESSITLTAESLARRNKETLMLGIQIDQQICEQPSSSLTNQPARSGMARNPSSGQGEKSGR